jgi:hypothetical protein
MSATAIAPSPTADATRLIEPWRTSPATKRPGWLDSRWRGARSSGHGCCGNRLGSDQHEERIGTGLDLLAPTLVADHDRPEPLVAARLDHLRTVADPDPVMRLDAIDEVPRHASVERVGAADDGDAAGGVGEVERRLSGGVRPADDDDVAVAAERGLGGRSAVVNAGTDQLVDAASLEPPVVDAVRRDGGAGTDGCAAGQLELERHAVAGHRVHELDADEDLGSEPGRLRIDVGGELGSAHAVREARVVLDPRARPGLAAGGERLDHERS